MWGCDQGVVAAVILVVWWVVFWLVILFGWHKENPNGDQ